jgi:hypothetical protein
MVEGTGLIRQKRRRNPLSPMMHSKNLIVVPNLKLVKSITHLDPQ